MKNILTLCITIIVFSLPMSLNAAGPCPIQGLDKKVCPIVVDFFDEMAKHDSEFAKHWQNHQWIQQAGDNYVPSINIKEHAQLTFSENRKREDLNTFITNVLNRASKNDPKFNNVLNSHNYFVMTVQAMHLYLQRGADHFNSAGSFINTPSGKRMEADIELEYNYNIQVKETDPYLNSAGIYTTIQHKYIQSTYIDTTSYQAGLKVNPVVITPGTPILATPKTPKVLIQGQQKTMTGATTPSVTSSTVNNNSGNYTSLNKKPGNKNRPVAQGNKIPTPKPLAPVLTPNKVPQATPQIVVAPNKVPTPTPDLVPQKQAYKVPTPMKSAGKNSSANHKLMPGASTTISTTVTQNNNAGNYTSLNKKPGNKNRPVAQGNKIPTPKPLAPILVPNKVPNPTPNLVPSKVAYTVPTPMKSSGKPSLTNINHKKAVAPIHIVVQKAPNGTNKSNINKRLITNMPGSQIDNNTRHYVLDDNSNIWSCKVSGLGFRVTKDSSGKVQAFGHVETNHIKSPQLAHIPASHTSGNKCLISVHK